MDLSRILTKGKRIFKAHPWVVTIVGLGVVSYTLHRWNAPENDITVSAPGKALIAGGYLVLEHPNVGIVISCTSRFYATARAIEYHEENIKPLERDSNCVLVVINSPQFHSVQVYSYNWELGLVEQVSQSGNTFVEKCIRLVFAFLLKHNKEKFIRKLKYLINKGQALAIKLRANNDFYSQIRELQKLDLSLLSSSLKLLSPFLPCPKDPITGDVLVAKTGMGSSAALTTSLVGVFLKYFNCIHLTNSNSNNETNIEDRRLVHNLAQLAHAVAQGKIGSGFDVSAAVYGTQMYQRFNPSGFKVCMDEYTIKKNPTKTDKANWLASDGHNASNAIYDAVMNQKLWDGCSVNKLGLPHGFDIVMGDVCGGSESVSMAKAVLEWRKNGGKHANKLWNDLGDTNIKIYDILNCLIKNENENNSIEYNLVINKLSKISSKSFTNSEILIEITSKCTTTTSSNLCKDIINNVCELKRMFGITRQLLKCMGDLAGVGIEPDNQTLLCDATEKIPGVLCAGVPGAGGVDAVFAFVLSKESRLRVEKMWSVWNKQTTNSMNNGAGAGTVVCPLTLSAETEPENSGIRLENLCY